MSRFSRRHILQSGAAIAALTPMAGCSGTTEPEAPTEPIEAEMPPLEATGSDYTAEAIPDGLTQLQMLQSGETTSLALTEAAIARSEAAHPLINAVAFRSEERRGGKKSK